MKITQSDGSTVDVRLVGDEDSHYCLSSDGFLLVPEKGILHYAVPGADGKPVASAYRAVDPMDRSDEVVDFLRSIDTKSMLETFRPDPCEAKRRGPGLFPNASFPTKGTQRTLVILVEYTDVKFRLPDPVGYFAPMLNQKGFGEYGGTGSARDYYLAASDGQFDIYFDVYGPVTLPHEMAWYGANSGGHDSTNARLMVVDACAALDSEIDFTEYDRDGDGTIDNVFLFYAGLGEATGGGADSVWPHSADVIGYYDFDGKRLKTYGCTNEWIMDDATTGHPDGIGAFCHEFGHVLGLPDLYATTYPTPAPFTPGPWALMDIGPYNNNGRTPPALDLFSRYALGWWTPDVIDAPLDGSIPPLADGAYGYMIPTGDGNEYFLVENRQKRGWDRFIPGHGLLIWHVEYDASIWMQHTVNNNANHQYVDIIEADDKKTDATRSGDTFPGDDGITSISGTSAPGFVLAGGRTLDFDLSEITEHPDGIVTFKALGGAAPAQATDAKEATEVTPRSFTAVWEASVDAVDYRLCVYTRHDGEIVYVPGYENRTTGNVTACEVKGLTPGTTYYYNVKVETASSTSLASNEVQVTTGELTHSWVLPETDSAIFVDDNSFTARWLPVEGADEYLLSVRQRNISEAETMVEAFDDKAAEWTTSALTFYNNESYVGASAPSLRLATDGYVTSPIIDAPVRSFSFWHRGRGAASAYITVDAYANRTWQQVKRFELATEKGGATIRVYDFPENTMAVRIMLHDPQDAATIYVDDFTLTYGGEETLTELPGWTKRSTGSYRSAEVTGLNPGTEYIYSVIAVRNGENSLESAGEHVITTGVASMKDVCYETPAPKISVRGTAISVSGANDIVTVADVAGRIVARAKGPNATLSLPSSGIYIVRCGDAAVKVVCF